MKRWLSHALQWTMTHQRRAILIVGGTLIVLTAGIAAHLVLRSLPEIKPQAIVVHRPPEPVRHYSPLTGKEVDNEAATTQATTAVMIENSPSARPQSGLKNSGIVFEAIAEGGVTRFLAIYQQEQPKLIGPVRSLRMYYVDWLAPFNASVAHVGGSQKSLQEIRNGTYRDIDEFHNSTTYWRATDRYAPHNVYTSFERINALNKAKKYTTSSFTGFNRKDSDAAKNPNATNVTVNVSSAPYNSRYTYHSDSNTYRRSQGGSAHLDREDGQISPRVVIAMMVNERTVLEDGWREQIDAVGGGVAHIFQDGTHQEVEWEKKNRASQIRFITKDGKPVELARGQTWITAVPKGKGSVSWQ